MMRDAAKGWAAGGRRRPPEWTVIQVRDFAEWQLLHEALDLVDLLTRDAPLDTDIHWIAAMLHQSLGRTEEAIGALERVVVLDPDHTEAKVRLGMLLASHGWAFGARHAQRSARRDRAEADTAVANRSPAARELASVPRRKH